MRSSENARLDRTHFALMDTSHAYKLRRVHGSLSENTMPKVDVIIPTYNRAEFLQAAIGSVLNQSFRDFTLLVVDDASADGES